MASFPGMLCDTTDLVAAALEKLQHFSELACDSEGVNLGRTGPMTLLQLSGTGASDGEEPCVFLFDIVALGSPSIFSITSSDGSTSLRSLLESDRVLKVTFDCRSDSEALWHQFKIKLRHVLDLQVFNQGVVKHREARSGASQPRKRKPVPCVPSMKKCVELYLGNDMCERLGFHADAPHKVEPGVWGVRPLSDEQVQYAANDCHSIRLMLARMRAEGVSEDMMGRVKAGSDDYVARFRDGERELVWPADKRLFLDERPI